METVDQLAHAGDGLRAQSGRQLAGKVFVVQNPSVGADDRSRPGTGTHRVDRHHHLRVHRTSSDMPAQMIGRDRHQPRGGFFMEIVPPSGLGCLANVGFVVEHDLSQLWLKIAIDRSSGSLQLPDQLGGIVLKRTLSNLTAQGTTQHHDLKRAQLVAGEPFALERLEHANQPATTTLPRRNLLLLFVGLLRGGRLRFSFSLDRLLGLLRRFGFAAVAAA